MAQGGDLFLSNQDFVTDRALLAFGQAGLGAGGCLTGNNFLGVAQGLDHLRLNAVAAGMILSCACQMLALSGLQAFLSTGSFLLHSPGGGVIVLCVDNVNIDTAVCVEVCGLNIDPVVTVPLQGNSNSAVVGIVQIILFLAGFVLFQVPLQVVFQIGDGQINIELAILALVHFAQLVGVGLSIEGNCSGSVADLGSAGGAVSQDIVVLDHVNHEAALHGVQVVCGGCFRSYGSIGVSLAAAGADAVNVIMAQGLDHLRLNAVAAGMILSCACQMLALSGLQAFLSTGSFLLHSPGGGVIVLCVDNVNIDTAVCVEVCGLNIDPVVTVPLQGNSNSAVVGIVQIILFLAGFVLFQVPLQVVFQIGDGQINIELAILALVHFAQLVGVGLSIEGNCSGSVADLGSAGGAVSQDIVVLDHVNHEAALHGVQVVCGGCFRSYGNRLLGRLQRQGIAIDVGADHAQSSMLNSIVLGVAVGSAGSIVVLAVHTVHVPAGNAFHIHVRSLHQLQRTGAALVGILEDNIIAPGGSGVAVDLAAIDGQLGIGAGDIDAAATCRSRRSGGFVHHAVGNVAGDDAAVDGQIGCVNGAAALFRGVAGEGTAVDDGGRLTVVDGTAQCGSVAGEGAAVDGQQAGSGVDVDCAAEVAGGVGEAHAAGDDAGADGVSEDMGNVADAGAAVQIEHGAGAIAGDGVAVQVDGDGDLAGLPGHSDALGGVRDHGDGFSSGAALESQICCIQCCLQGLVLLAGAFDLSDVDDFLPLSGIDSVSGDGLGYLGSPTGEAVALTFGSALECGSGFAFCHGVDLVGEDFLVLNTVGVGNGVLDGDKSSLQGNTGIQGSVLCVVSKDNRVVLGESGIFCVHIPAVCVCTFHGSCVDQLHICGGSIALVGSPENIIAVGGCSIAIDCTAGHLNLGCCRDENIDTATGCCSIAGNGTAVNKRITAVNGTAVAGGRISG